MALTAKENSACAVPKFHQNRKARARRPGLDGVDGPLTASIVPKLVFSNTNGREPSMEQVTTVGLDLAKDLSGNKRIDF